MSKMRFILNNFVNTSTLDVENDNVEPALPVENLKKISRATVVQSIDTTDFIITGVFSNDQDVSAIVIGRHNLITGCTWELELFQTFDFLTSVYQAGPFPVTADQSSNIFWGWGDFGWGTVPWGGAQTESSNASANNLVHWIVDGNGDEDLQVNVKSFKITIKLGTATAINYFEVSRLFIGNFIQPTYNLSYGHGLSWTEKTKQYRTELGSLRSDVGVPYRKFEFSLGTIGEDDRVVLQAELANIGLRTDLFLSIFPDNTEQKGEDYSGIVKLTKIPKFTEFQCNWYKSKYVMEEV